jgi:hypothetical protein
MFEIKMLSALSHILGIGGSPLVLQFIDPSVYRYYAGFLEQPFGVKIDQVTKTQTKEAKDEKDPRNPKKEG